MVERLIYNNSDWPAVYQNLNKARRQWGVIARVLAKTGSMVRARGMMYKAVGQFMILYRSNSWVVTGAMLKVVEGFHHQAARRIKGMTATSGAGGE